MDIKKKLGKEISVGEENVLFLKKTFILRLTVQFMQKYLICRELCKLKKQNKTAHPKAEN